MAITSVAPTIHGVECYEAWRASTDCPHESRNTNNQPKETSTMQTNDYVITLGTRKGSEPRYHRAKCGKVKADQVVTTTPTTLAMALPCSSCQPPAAEVEPALVDQAIVAQDGDVWVKANEERQALKAWKDGDKKGNPPATPNLDLINGETITPTRKARGTRKAGAAKATAKAGPAVRLYHDGKPMPDSQNKLSSVAYYHTKDVAKGKPRVGTDDLRAILAKAGIADPEHTAWSHTLANGVVLSSVVEGATAAVAS